VPTKIARIYRRYLLANARGNVDWSYRWFALFERATNATAALYAISAGRVLLRDHKIGPTIEAGQPAYNFNASGSTRYCRMRDSPHLGYGRCH